MDWTDIGSTWVEHNHSPKSTNFAPRPKRYIFPGILCCCYFVGSLHDKGYTFMTSLPQLIWANATSGHSTSPPPTSFSLPSIYRSASPVASAHDFAPPPPFPTLRSLPKGPGPVITGAHVSLVTLLCVGRHRGVAFAWRNISTVPCDKHTAPTNNHPRHSLAPALASWSFVVFLCGAVLLLCLSNFINVACLVFVFSFPPVFS